MNRACCSLLLLLFAAGSTLAADSRIVVFEQGKSVKADSASGRLAKYTVGIPFVLRVLTTQPPEAIQVCASRDRKVLEQVKTGLHIAKIPCFMIGTGMATSGPGDDPRKMELFLSDGDGHNYYSPERRVDGSGHTDLFIAGLVGTSGKNETGGTVHAIVFVDDNRNNLIEDREYELLELVIRR